MRSCLCNGTFLPSQGALGLFIIIFSLIFFHLTVFTNIYFLSLFHFYFFYHYPCWVDFFFTFQHSPGCFWLVSIVHSTSLVAFSFSYYFRVFQTGILKGLWSFSSMLDLCKDLLSILHSSPLGSAVWSVWVFPSLLFAPNSYIFWWFPSIYFSYCLPVFFLAPHYFLFLSFLGIESCSLLFSSSCCLFPSLLLLLLVQPTLVLSRFFSLQCSLFFCKIAIYIFLLLSCLLLLLHTERLVVPLLSNMFSPSLLDGNFFRWKSLSSRSINIFIFSSFRSFVLQTHLSLLVLSLLSTYFSSSTTSILLTFSHFSFILNRMHPLFRSFSWKPYFPPISHIYNFYTSCCFPFVFC